MLKLNFGPPGSQTETDRQAAHPANGPREALGFPTAENETRSLGNFQSVFQPKRWRGRFKPQAFPNQDHPEDPTEVFPTVSDLLEKLQLWFHSFFGNLGPWRTTLYPGGRPSELGPPRAGSVQGQGPSQSRFRQVHPETDHSHPEGYGSAKLRVHRDGWPLRKAGHAQWLWITSYLPDQVWSFVFLDFIICETSPLNFHISRGCGKEGNRIGGWMGGWMGRLDGVVGWGVAGWECYFFPFEYLKNV